MNKITTEKCPVCYIVVPCFNEEEVLPLSAPVFLKKLEQLQSQKKIAASSKILFIDDGSSDSTWEKIISLHTAHANIIGLKLSKNCGHQNALLAGLLYSKDLSDITISFDADLQDDINVVDSFVDKYEQGAHIVCGVRSDRSNDSFFKRVTAQVFYRTMKLLGVNLIYNHADCRLMSKQALQALACYPEENLFLRGIIANLGFKTEKAYYARQKRTVGKGKYPLHKMLSFAWEGLTSFSLLPIRLISCLGFLSAAMSVLMFCYFFIGKLLGSPVPGYASLICSIWFIGGMQLFAISIIGEYIGKTYIETKRRPRYIVEQTLE